MTLTVRRWGDLDELVHSSLFRIISPEQIQRMKQEALYHERQTSFCRSAEGQNLLHHTVFACFYRPMGHPDHGWSGDYAPPRIDLGASSERLSFSCTASTADAHLTECTVFYTLKHELDLEYTWVEIRYGITLDAPTRANLIDQVTAYDNALRASLAAVEVPGYNWPPETLAQWRAAQPTDESLRQQSQAIYPTR